MIFTSHDRSFMQAVATTMIEVGNGRVVNSLGDYAAYLAAVSREIDDAEAADGRGRTGRTPPPPRREGGKAPAAKAPARTDREVRKEIATLERTIARLDEEKKQANVALLSTTDAEEAVRLHAAMTGAAEKLSASEEKWLALQEELGSFE